ncbi:hypothetical protein K402DRAFT_340936 [Aulographum hederae CBS 113979]|uniref:Peptidase M43 pregnancy-associated plasma-A domain-containing protein n=1 Tax=Aulographum hederae CBS 113979 TaxID=1176131 RepID=A0A6G1GN49_9PEZI|nr:hypothetical protein K402DRAFT_340936 [Aulographum hederae CBS 113979]
MASVALADIKHFDCGTDTSGAKNDFLKSIQDLHARDLTSTGAPGARHRVAALRARDSSAITTDAYFHVITTNAKKDAITQKMADDQISALNTAYKSSNVQFNLVNTSFTVNDAWAVGSGDDDGAMKAALRAGGYSALNIYFQTDLDGGILGRCSLPSDQGPSPVDRSIYVNDGCNVNAHTMPGGSQSGYDAGQTAVHETGHWMGLLHVFEGYTCDGNGDFIGDTPMQSESTDGCPTGSPAKDTCPGGGVDAIHNIMDYSIDSCYQGFSDGQVARMYDMWGKFRQGK